MLKKATVTLFAVIVGTFVSGVAARGVPSRAPCGLDLGPDKLMFSARQPGGADDSFCQTIPSFGETDITLEARDPTLAAMQWDIRIMRDVGEGAEPATLEENTERHFPFSKYANGAATIHYFFNSDDFFELRKNYVLMVTARSDDGAQEYAARHPFVIDGTIALKAQAEEFFSTLLPLLAFPAAIMWLLLRTGESPTRRLLARR